MHERELHQSYPVNGALVKDLMREPKLTLADVVQAVETAVKTNKLSVNTYFTDERTVTRARGGKSLRYSSIIALAHVFEIEPEDLIAKNTDPDSEHLSTPSSSDDAIGNGQAFLPLPFRTPNNSSSAALLRWTTQLTPLFGRDADLIALRQ